MTSTARAIAVGLFTALFAEPCAAQALLPPPSYDTTFYVYVYTSDVQGSDAAFQAAADVVQQAMTPGPYAEIGLADYFAADMSWNFDLANPALFWPNRTALESVLGRLRARHLRLHMTIQAGMSRGTWVYDPAKTEDRRNAQWYKDGSIATPAQLAGPQGFSTNVYMTPSRYARKLRRHLEAKARAFAKLLEDLREEYPETLISASGDAEFELNSEAEDGGLAYQDQMVADYSPFAILEFRDWIQQAGLYAPGGPYAGQGYASGTALYQGASGLDRFNLDFGTGFSSWSLRYFDWSLSDPIDSDTQAVPRSVYDQPGWNPLPSSGPSYVAAGFDAPRTWDVPTPAFWQLWLTFRQSLVAHYVQDFAGWITSTPATSGATFPAARLYTHQIPADYVNGTCPGCPDPNARLYASASPMQTAVVDPGIAGVGFTSLDVLWGDGYHRTSQYLYDAVRGLNLPNWALVEYSPAWNVGALPESNLAVLTAQMARARDAGAHLLCFTPWPHFVGMPMADAFGAFVSQVKFQPRLSASVSYTPPVVSGLAGTAGGATVALTWNSQIFAGVAGFSWSSWPDFEHFEVWRGASPTFGASDGEFLKSVALPSAAGVSLDVLRPYYRVRAVSRSALAGDFSTAWTAPTAGSGFYPVTPCRVFDTRDPDGAYGGPAIGVSGTRAFPIRGRCGIPATAKSVSVNITVVNPGSAGDLRLFPSDADVPPTSSINFGAAQVRANNAILPLSPDGATSVFADLQAGTVHVILDVNGYFE